MADSTGMADIRAEHINKIVTGFALQQYVFKNLVITNNSSANQESYYQETAADLTGGLGSAVSGVPRLSDFPYGEVSFTKKSSYFLKHGMEGVISWEDMRTNNVDVIARTLLRMSRAVTKSVDTAIWNTLTEDQTPVDINTLALTAGYEWDSATVANRDPIQDILNAIKLLQEDNYDPLAGNGFLAVSPKDFANLLGNSNVKNSGQFYTDAVTRNGRVGKLLGLNVFVSNSVTADKALVGIAKECGTYQQVSPLKVESIDDPGVKTTIRAWEVGSTQLTNPQALCLITNTAA